MTRLRYAAIVFLAVLGMGANGQGNKPEPPRESNGLALTPPMGWNSWNQVRLQHPRRPGASGSRPDGLLRPARCGLPVRRHRRLLATKRDGEGRIVADAEKFPSGIKALADYIHSKGAAVWHLLRRRDQDLRWPPWQPRPRVSGRHPVRGLGRGLPEGTTGATPARRTARPRT